MKLKGAQVKKVAAARAAAGSAAVATLAARQATKVVIVQCRDEAGHPWGGLAVEVTLPGGPKKKTRISESGWLLVGGAKPGACKVAFPAVKDPVTFGKGG